MIDTVEIKIPTIDPTAEEETLEAQVSAHGDAVEAAADVGESALQVALKDGRKWTWVYERSHGPNGETPAGFTRRAKRMLADRGGRKTPLEVVIDMVRHPEGMDLDLFDEIACLAQMQDGEPITGIGGAGIGDIDWAGTRHLTVRASGPES